ncbi:hypothetical protein J2X46_001320 [Nocardioides sp. BE266]|uniref:NYN domain-containing protein n=1 Tax=Nocardioides sp. BE266 TaxID=2817725 RepID=UPI00286126F5|nr:NYN domain-containing protein [Nocardioides sp. BE266]MDR7252344.1 hypothetical protein [Nocardioides sp. BE266]
MRLGVLIHAETVAPEAWAPLARVLGDLGEVAVARAYADWSAAAVAPWFPVLRRHRIQLRHQFRTRSTQDPALVAMAMDAPDFAAGCAADGVVLAGDVGSSMPVLLRLREQGLAVVVAGPPSTPLDIRDACSDFVDLATLRTDGPDPGTGRHRA